MIQGQSNYTFSKKKKQKKNQTRLIKTPVDLLWNFFPTVKFYSKLLWKYNDFENSDFRRTIEIVIILIRVECECLQKA